MSNNMKFECDSTWFTHSKIEWTWNHDQAGWIFQSCPQYVHSALSWCQNDMPCVKKKSLWTITSLMRWLFPQFSARSYVSNIWAVVQPTSEPWCCNIYLQNWVAVGVPSSNLSEKMSGRVIHWNAGWAPQSSLWRQLRYGAELCGFWMFLM